VLLGFLVGAAGGGMLVTRLGRHRGRLLRGVAVVELVLVSAAVAVAFTSVLRVDAPAAVLIAALLALAMGMQNTAARGLTVPDLTTTVLTMTLTGIAADVRSPAGVVVRRVLSVVTMFAGAVAGSVLVLHAGVAAALATAMVLLAAVVMVSTVCSHVVVDRRPGTPLGPDHAARCPPDALARATPETGWPSWASSGTKRRNAVARADRRPAMTDPTATDPTDRPHRTHDRRYTMLLGDLVVLRSGPPQRRRHLSGRAGRRSTAVSGVRPAHRRSHQGCPATRPVPDARRQGFGVRIGGSTG
jgi:uncharacterized membrane protein YoaK (UPF0700 family)